MKEKLGIAMIFSTSLTVLLLVLTLAFPQLIDEAADTTSFAKGLGAALGSCGAGLIAAFKYNKNSCSDKS